MRSLMMAAALFAAGAPPSRAATRELQCPGCNVVLVTIDVLRADELGAVRGGKEVVPNLDALAARGIVFSDAFSPSPDTMPTSISIMNGLYPSHHGARVPLRDKAIQDEWAGSRNTIAAILKRRGYVIQGMQLQGSSALNSLLGKEMALGEPSNGRDLGGKRFFLMVRGDVHDPYFPSFDDVRALDPSISEAAYPNREDVLRCQIASGLAKKIPDNLRVHRGDWDSISEPLPDQVRGIVDGADAAERLRAARGFDPLGQYRLASQCYWSFFSSSTIGTARLLYDAKLRSVDRALGEFMRGLETEGLLKNSLVVVTSQHGEEFLEHGHVDHSDQIYDESLHVPLILSLPGLREGRVIAGLSSSVDVMPTILGALGIKPPGKLDGRDLLACLGGGCGRRYVFSEWNKTFSVRDDQFSYIRYPFREELFDRRLDPGERHDIASREPRALSRMRAALSAQTLGASGYEDRWPAWVNDKLRAQIERGILVMPGA